MVVWGFPGPGLWFGDESLPFNGYVVVPAVFPVFRFHLRKSAGFFAGTALQQCISIGGPVLLVADIDSPAKAEERIKKPGRNA